MVILKMVWAINETICLRLVIHGVLKLYVCPHVNVWQLLLELAKHHHSLAHEDTLH